MTNATTASRLDQTIGSLAKTFPGPGGAVAVLKDGQVLVRHAWGYANAERRIPFTPRTLFRMCSITKQFTCALVLDAFADPTVLDADVQARFPRLAQPAPGALHLCHNQSGLRDYWAIAMLQGSPVEAPFGDQETGTLIGQTQTLQFAPGTRNSYCNQNFRILSDILQDRTGRSFAELLRSRIFDRVGMGSAFLAADTRSMPDGTEGYEGWQGGGFRVAENNVLWTGDAGLGASLDDMIAWERHIDATRDDPDGLYRRLSASVAFADGQPARYGFGLARDSEWGRAFTSHGGALRGWRSHRLYVPQDRVSVVVMFNHLSNAHAAAMNVLAAMLDVDHAKPDPSLPHPDWLGTYRDPETGLAVQIVKAAAGQVQLRFGTVPEMLDLDPDGSAGRQGTRLRVVAGDLWMDRPQDNLSTCLERQGGAGPTDLAGRYRCDEWESDLVIEQAGGIAYGGFSGPLGSGRMELLNEVGTDMLALPCHRALDQSPPGDWTLVARRGAAGQVTGLEVGCWLSRGLIYHRL